MTALCIASYADALSKMNAIREGLGRKGVERAMEGKGTKGERERGGERRWDRKGKGKGRVGEPPKYFASTTPVCVSCVTRHPRSEGWRKGRTVPGGNQEGDKTRGDSPLVLSPLLTGDKGASRISRPLGGGGKIHG